MGDLLLKDYAPRSTLELEEHLVEKPRFPVIDAHNHLTWVEGTLATLDVPSLLDVMDQCGIRAIVNLDGWGEHFERHLAKYDGAHPGRFVTFACVDWSRITEPGFGEEAAIQLERSVDMGARGLKIFKELGLEYRDGIPVTIHVSDPKCFWQPMDRFNEGYLALQNWPGCRYFEKDVPRSRDLVEAGVRLIRRHPETTFIAAHTGWFESLPFVGEHMLDELPNLYVDISASIAFLGRQPYTAREFMIRYQDRVLFGTDSLPSTKAYQGYFRWLETADEYFEAGFEPPYAFRRLYGIYLPDEVLEKIYHKNALRLIPGLS
jgi:hypothetical protein